MEIQRLTLPTPYPVGPVMAYLLPGPPLTLVDCGPKTPEALAALEEGLARGGRSLAAVERLILTHGHVDHFGLAATVAAVSGARVYAHQADVPKLTLDRSFITPMRDMIAEAGFEPAVSEALMGALRRYRDQFDPITPTDLVADGDRVPLGDGHLAILHTPGHAQGHICLWQDGTLVSGDLLLEEISPNPLVEFAQDGRRLRTLPSLLASLRKVADLAPTLAYPGHGEPIPQPAARALALLHHHEARRDRLAHLLADRAWTLRDLAASWFPGLEQVNLLLGLSEVLGHLDLLDEEGRLAVERRGGVAHYSLAAPPRAAAAHG